MSAESIKEQLVGGGIKAMSLCNTCYREVAARYVLSDDIGIELVKECPNHGEQRAHIMDDENLFIDLEQLRASQGLLYGVMVGIVSVTDKCNLKCAHCYHPVSAKTEEPSIDLIMARATVMGMKNVALMGAEPTMRKDLPLLISRMVKNGFTLHLYTNGIMLSEMSYAERIANAGVGCVALSLHTSEYECGDESAFSKKIRSISNMIVAGIKLNHISFTVESEDDAREALDIAFSLDAEPHHFRIRGAYSTGSEGTGPDIEDLIHIMVKYGEDNGLERPEIIVNTDNSIYHINVSFGDKIFRLINVPTVENIDILHLRQPPFAAFNDGLYLNFAHAAVVQDGIRKGWFAGRRIGNG